MIKYNNGRIYYNIENEKKRKELYDKFEFICNELMNFREIVKDKIFLTSENLSEFNTSLIEFSESIKDFSREIIKSYKED